jgi:beta-glucosidase
MKSGRTRRGPAWALAAAVIAAGGVVGLPGATSGAVAASSAGPAKCGPWMSANQSPATRAQELLKVLTLDQKIQMVHQALADTAGSDGAAGYVPGIPSLCVPPLYLNDAGSGLADGQTDVTAYPAAIAQASTWDTNLERQVGTSLGQESFDKGVNVLLAPDVNIARSPLGGRTSEGFGEDPYLAGQMGVAFVQGVQSQHVIATPKQFNANNQETNRSSINEIVSQRTLEEIYDAPFAATVTEGGAGAVMCAYNKVNGAYSCQNGPVLESDLNKEMDFKGFVMSDWGATHSTVASALNGLDMEMDVVQEPDALHSLVPVDNALVEDYFGAPLKAAVESGQVPMSDLNSMVERILYAMFEVGLFDHPAAAEPLSYLTPVDTSANKAVALQTAENGSVLLKNAESVLPLSGAHKRIVLIGLDAGPEALMVDEAGGSVRVDQPDVVTPLQAITLRAAEAGDTVTYYDGTDPTVAAALARTANVAIVYAGYLEEEGQDLTSLNFTNGVCTVALSECVTEPANSNQLISAVAAANPKTVVVLNTGGPTLMPWLSQVSSVLEMWYPGEEDGNAAAALLFGDVNPSGKLPITFPASLSQLPTNSASQWPGIGGTSVYSEGLLVGYRWYDAKGITPLFPFGFGLSYTSFRIDDLQVTRVGDHYQLTCSVTNTGGRAGADVAQVYVSDPPAAGEPPQQLKAFQKVFLRPGQSSTVTVDLSSSAFDYWSTSTSSWQVEPGNYTIRVGDSSAHDALTAVLPNVGGTVG